MSEIPEDIAKAAYDAGLEIRCLLATHELIHHSDYVDAIIAKAIFDERQRCAKIADEEYRRTYLFAAQRIHQAILKPGTTCGEGE